MISEDYKEKSLPRYSLEMIPLDSCPREVVNLFATKYQESSTQELP